MSSLFSRLLVFSCIVFFVISGCAVQNVKDDMEVVINPNRSYEECVALFENQVLDYSFSTSKPVDFNIHYHAVEDIMYPVSQKNVTSWRGSFSPLEEKHYTKEQEYFCMMWENPHSEHVSLKCNFKVMER